MATKTSSKKTTSRKSGAASKATKTVKSQKAQVNELIAPVLKRAKSAGWLAILESLIVGVLGIILVWNPNGFLEIVFYVLGIFLIVKGVFRIVNFFAMHSKYDFYNNDLFYGIIALVLGIVCVALRDKLGDTFNAAVSIIVGAWLIYGSLVRLNTAVKLHAAGVKEWFYVLLLSLLLLALGIYVIINTGAAFAMIGWIMIVAAIIGIADDAIFIKNIDALKG